MNHHQSENCGWVTDWVTCLLTWVGSRDTRYFIWTVLTPLVDAIPNVRNPASSLARVCDILSWSRILLFWCDMLWLNYYLGCFIVLRVVKHKKGNPYSLHVLESQGILWSRLLQVEISDPEVVPSACIYPQSFVIANSKDKYHSRTSRNFRT